MERDRPAPCHHAGSRSLHRCSNQSRSTDSGACPADALVVTAMSPAFYRREATRHRLLAGLEIDRTAADKLRRAAAEYDDLADDFEEAEVNPDQRKMH